MSWAACSSTPDLAISGAPDRPGAAHSVGACRLTSCRPPPVRWSVYHRAGRIGHRETPDLNGRRRCGRAAGRDPPPNTLRGQGPLAQEARSASCWAPELREGRGGRFPAQPRNGMERLAGRGCGQRRLGVVAFRSLVLTAGLGPQRRELACLIGLSWVEFGSTQSFRANVCRSMAEGWRWLPAGPAGPIRNQCAVELPACRSCGNPAAGLRLGRLLPARSPASASSGRPPPCTRQEIGCGGQPAGGHLRPGAGLQPHGPPCATSGPHLVSCAAPLTPPLHTPSTRAASLFQRASGSPPGGPAL